MAELRRSGRSVADIAGLFGVSRRTVERALKNKRPKVKRQNDKAKVKNVPSPLMGEG
jgi:predicted transcriptional regulator